jgi:hypothetical protein
MPQAETVPAGYRLWFGTLEPLMGISGFYFNHINPPYLLRTLNPSYNTLLPMTPETRLLLDTTTGLYAQNLFLQLVLTRARPNDVGLWKIWQSSLLVVDTILMSAVLRNLSWLGVLGVPGKWSGEQWANVVIMIGLLVVRTAFVAGYGFGKGRNGVGEKREAR